jgi:hypothetical protein
MNNNNKLIEEMTVETMQSDTRQEKYVGVGGNGSGLFMFFLQAGDLVPAWWSAARDVKLRKFVKESDHLGGAVFSTITKLSSIPLRIIPRDLSIKTHGVLADKYLEYIKNISDFGRGWEVFYSKFLEDFYTQDNGAFAEIIGEGDKDGEIVGIPLGIAHLDSFRCQRTSNPIYPVLYHDTDGKIYKLHRTRVMFASQMPSPIANMYGVGTCAISRCINAAQNLLDIAIYKQEKLGSRPRRQILVTQGGLDPDDFAEAIKLSDQSESSQSLRRFSKTIAVGSRNLENADIKELDLLSTPDGFDEMESSSIGMAIVALAFGEDVREIFPIGLGASTKADAIIQHIKQRGKGAGYTIGMMQRLLDTYVLPPYLKAEFDYQDDAQDRQIADIQNIRATSRQRNIITSTIDVRTARELMKNEQELTREQFEQLELKDGRLEDGTSVLVLFHSKLNDFVEFLSGVTELNFEEKKENIMEVIITSKDVDKIKNARKALAAIIYKFETLPQKKLMESMNMQQPNGNISRNGNISAGQDDSFDSEKYDAGNSNKFPRDTTRAPDEENEMMK